MNVDRRDSPLLQINLASKERRAMAVSDLSPTELALIAAAEIPVEHRCSLSSEPEEP
jgi:hypothetical protein